MFTRPEAKRIKAVAMAMALATWLTVITFLLLAALRLHPVALAALALSIVLWAISLLLAWSLYCPWCCKPLFFIASMADSPGLTQLLQRLVPYEVVVHGRIKCPYCRSRFALPSAERVAR